MIESTIHFIISLVKVFVKFLSDIEITLYGYTFSFYSFFLASVLILAIVGIAINSIRMAGNKIGNDLSHKRDKVKSKKSHSNDSE